MLGSSKSKTKFLLMLAEAGWDPTGRFFTVEDNSLFPSPQNFWFSAQDQLPLTDLVPPQLPPQQDQGDPAGCPAQALAQKVLWMEKPSPEQDKAAVRALRKAQLEEGSSPSGSQEGSHQLGGVGAKSDPSIAINQP